jgi:hypothetical protein
MHRGVPLLQRRAPHSADLHHRSGRAFHKPRFHRFTGHRFTGHRFTGHRFTGHRFTGHDFKGHNFKGPRVLSFQRPGPRFKSPGVVVRRPSGFDSFVRHHRQPRHHRDGKLIILSPSVDGFKHIVIVPSHSHWAD